MKTNYLHLRVRGDSWTEVSPFGGITVGYRINSVAQTITYSYSRVSDKDRYNKSIGRKQVDGQLDAGLRCNVITADVLFTHHYVTNIVGGHAIHKLSITDLNWPIVTSTIRNAVEADLEGSYPINRLA